MILDVIVLTPSINLSRLRTSLTMKSMASQIVSTQACESQCWQPWQHWHTRHLQSQHQASACWGLRYAAMAYSSNLNYPFQPWPLDPQLSHDAMAHPPVGYIGQLTVRSAMPRQIGTEHQGPVSSQFGKEVQEQVAAGHVTSGDHRWPLLVLSRTSRTFLGRGPSDSKRYDRNMIDTNSLWGSKGICQGRWCMFILG